MELRQLRYFAEVARSGSFSQASAVLSVAQPAVSRQIKRLEEEVGTELLYRHGRGVTLTRSGDKFLSVVRRTLGELEMVCGEIAAERETPRGPVTLGMPPTLSGAIGAGLLHRLRKHWPEIRLHIIDGFSGHVHEWLLSGRIDIAILHQAQHASSIMSDPVLSEDLYLFGRTSDDLGARARPDGTMALADLAGVPLIVPGQHHGLRRQLDRISAEAGIKLTIEMEVDALGTIKELAMAGTGYTILPLAAIRRDALQEGLAAWRIVEPEIANVLVLAMSQSRPVTPAMREVCRSLRQQIGQIG